jgi:hypothetical protein
MSEDNVQNDSVTQASEIEARKFGWSPLEEFKGEESQWRTADEFLQRGKEINGFLRKDLQKIQDKNDLLETELRSVRETVGEFKKFHEQTEERSYKKALADLQAQKKEAITDGDGSAVVEIENAIDKLKEERTPVQAKPEVNPQDEIYRKQFVSWQGQNEWFQKDKSLRAAANGFADEVKLESPGLIGTDFLEAVGNKVREAFPERFEQNAREKPSAVEGNTGTPRGNGNKKSFADLPPEAKAACDKFVKEGLVTREQYINDYFEG